jgi:parvulin-like peptidyl-prolyl isomerase
MKSKIGTLAIILLVTLLTAAGAAAQSKPSINFLKAPTRASAPAPKVVARVNGAALSDHDLMRQMMVQFPYAKQHGGKFPAQMEKDIRQSALATIEFEELAYQEAQRRKMTVGPAKLERAMRDFRKQFLTSADFSNYLYAEHQGSMEILRAKVKRAILIDQVLRTDVQGKATLTEAQLREVYSKNPERFRKPESVSLQTISILIPDNATPQVKAKLREKADSLAKQAKTAKDYEAFGVLAEKNSDDDWRVMMGDHKWVHRGRMPPPVEQAVFNMKAGEVTGVIEAENSFCIARVNGREAAQVVPYAKVRTQLKKDLETQHAEQLRTELEARLRKGAKIEEF